MFNFFVYFMHIVDIHSNLILVNSVSSTFASFCYLPSSLLLIISASLKSDKLFMDSFVYMVLMWCICFSFTIFGMPNLWFLLRPCYCKSLWKSSSLFIEALINIYSCIHSSLAWDHLNETWSLPSDSWLRCTDLLHAEWLY